MGIFDFSRPDNYSKISEEWQIFESVFPDTGAFKYLSSRKTAYLDDNTYRILRIEKKSEDGSMEDKEFFEILKTITVEPVYNKRHIYNYHVGNESFWIKLCMVEKDGQWLGFVKDMTSMMQEINFSESFSILDSFTKLSNKDAFLEELRILSESRKIQNGCLASFHINGINQLNNILGIDNSKKCISSVARTILPFKSDDVIIGTTPYHEFLIFFRDKTEQQAIELIKQIMDSVHKSKITDDFGEALIPGSDNTLSLNCGYSLYPKDSQDFNKLVDYSGFALFEIIGNTTGMIKRFERNSYEREKEYYSDSQIFSKIIEDNLFEYHLQPIVDAKTGAVFGYEALMRTIGNKYLNPFRMLEIAKKQKRMYDIEKKTFFNVMKILNDNLDMFQDKKLFLNCITDHILTDEDFETLNLMYSSLMDKVVIEVTEQAELTEDFVEKITKRRNNTGFEIALDDYGTGYSNSANLLKCDPEYIKIDRSLVMNIDSDQKRKNLVGSIVSFAAKNNIKTLAEGIENASELATVINLGVDLIQGYYTSRPKPFILYEISKEVKDEIVNVNALKDDAPRSFYVDDDMATLELNEINTDIYSEVLVRCGNIRINGDGKEFDSGIVINSELECVMEINNVNITSKLKKPAILLGENTSLTLIAEGENTFNNLGIYVPQTASLKLIGSGTLNIVIVDEDEPYGIGADIHSAYGDISVDMTGKLNIRINGKSNVAIGGGRNPSASRINLVSGDISIENSGKICVSVGNADGNSIIDIGKDCNLNIESSSIENVSVGSLRKGTNITTSGNVVISGSGSNVIGIGVLENGSGIINIDEGTIDISFGAKQAYCIGTNGGNIMTHAEKSVIILSAGGINVIGIGDCSGGGTVSLSNNDIKIKLNGENTIDIGSPMGTVMKNGNKIVTKINC